MGKVKYYYWYLVTNDEYELPITPVFDYAKELSDFLKCNPSTLYKNHIRERNTENFGRNSKYKLVKVERD